MAPPQLRLIVFVVTAASVLAKQTPALPMVDPGLFVISGVSTCGSGSGYCLLGTDCSLDQDFIEDTTGHCQGLKGAFTPSAHFVCCRDSRHQNEILDPPRAIDPMVSVRNDTSENDINPLANQQNDNAIFHSRKKIDFENLGKSLNVTNMDVTEVENELITTTTESQNDETTETPPSEEYTNSTTELPADVDENDKQVVPEDETGGAENCSQYNCTTSVKFYNEDMQICLGTIVENSWVLTSASCALRIFRIGMVNVLVSAVDQPEFNAAVKTIIVNENYRPSVANILLPEANNVGLIRLNETFHGKCIPCLPSKNDAFAGEICNTLVNATSASSAKSGITDVVTCESEVETMLGEAKEEFLTLSCDSTSSHSRYLGGEVDSGKALICNGFLAGVETSSGVGMTVFTNIAYYSDWIRQNLKPNTRQYFQRINN